MNEAVVQEHITPELIFKKITNIANFSERKAELARILTIHKNSISLQDYLALEEVFHKSYDFESAIQILYTALEIHIDNQFLLKLLANNLYHANHHEKLEEIYKKLIALGSKDFPVFNELLKSFISRKRYDLGLEVTRQMMVNFPNIHFSYFNRANIEFQLGNIDQAIKYVFKTLELAPKFTIAFRLLIDCYFKKNDFSQAYNICSHIIDNFGYDQHLLSKMFYIKHKLTITKYDEYFDCQALVKIKSLPQKQSESLNDFGKFLLNHQSLSPSTEDYSTRNGFHTGSIINENNPLMQHYKEYIYNTVLEYLEDISKKIPAISVFKSKNFELSGWAVRMGKNGYQDPHIHPAGIVSGVFYVSVPDVINTTTSNEGWLRFGRMPSDFVLSPEDREMVEYIKPEKGLLVLFPSYMWHDTVPIDSPQERISFAFDLVTK